MEQRYNKEEMNDSRKWRSQQKTSLVFTQESRKESECNGTGTRANDFRFFDPISIEMTLLAIDGS